MVKKYYSVLIGLLISIYCFAGPVPDREKLPTGKIMFEDFIKLPIEQQIVEYIENNVWFLQFPDDKLARYMSQNYSKELIPIIYRYSKLNSITNENEVYVLEKMSYLLWRLRIDGLIDDKIIYYFYGMYQDKIINYLDKTHIIDENIVLAEHMLYQISGVDVIKTEFPNYGEEITKYYKKMLFMDDLENVIIKDK